mmetsp:Transcript_17339/g.61650  ORF Transcript_17339/g.61650 Transcript_17339/m.61650 type:complete len:277 (-) Transcript_17339:533-1363(-)
MLYRAQEGAARFDPRLPEQYGPRAVLSCPLPRATGRRFEDDDAAKQTWFRAAFRETLLRSGLVAVDGRRREGEKVELVDPDADALGDGDAVLLALGVCAVAEAELDVEASHAGQRDIVRVELDALGIPFALALRRHHAHSQPRQAAHGRARLERVEIRPRDGPIKGEERKEAVPPNLARTNIANDAVRVAEGLALWPTPREDVVLGRLVRKELEAAQPGGGRPRCLGNGVAVRRRRPVDVKLRHARQPQRVRVEAVRAGARRGPLGLVQSLSSRRR